MDGGYILAGSTGSNDGDVSGNHGGSDVWVMKMDANGNLQWQKTFGGSDNENAISIVQTTDGGYFVLASTQSPNNGDVTGNHGLLDAWVLRLDASGNLAWQKCFGGTGSDYGESLALTSDGGFIISAHTNSSDGDVSGNHGSRDAWVVKLDGAGNLQWKRCYGGSLHEGETSIVQTADGGYVLAANATSTDGDVTTGPGGGDFWIVKLNPAGAIQWQKSFCHRAYGI